MISEVILCKFGEIVLKGANRQNFESGLVKEMRRRASPYGTFKIYYKQRIDMAYTLKERIGYIIRYNAFNILSHNNKYNYNGKYKHLVLAFKPFGWLLTKYYKHK